MAARGEKFKSELDFVTSNMMLEIVADFSLVWLLSPSRMLGPMPTGKLARAIAMLPGHATQKGDFKLWQRFATYGYRGAQFFCVGIVSTLVRLATRPLKLSPLSLSFSPRVCFRQRRHRIE